MEMEDLGHGVKVSVLDRTYYKVTLEDSCMDRKGPDGKIQKVPVTIRANEKHSLHEWPLSEVQKQIITDTARTTLRRLSKKELLERTAENGMETPGIFEHITPEEARGLFQDNVVLRNEILRSPEFKDAVADYVKTLASQGDGSLLDAIKDADNPFEDPGDEDVDEEEILKEELNESNDNAGVTTDTAPKTREASVKGVGPKSESKSGGTAKKRSPRKTNANAVSK